MSDWELLGVPRNATRDEVKSAYRKLCLQHHPDLFPSDQRAAAEVRFRTVVEAYNRLYTGGGRTHARTPSYDPHQPRRTYQWARTPAKRFSNGMVATALCVPLMLTGIYFAANGDRVPENFGRPHGLLQPPVNPYLADSWKPRQHRSGLFNGGGATGGADTAGGR